jgi:tetratricopeptide (TPR) repeat protein
VDELKIATDVFETIYCIDSENIGIAEGLAKSHIRLADSIQYSYVPQGKVVAGNSYKRALEIYESLYSFNPYDINLAKGLVNSLYDIANYQDDWDEKRKSYEKSMVIWKALYLTNPKNVDVALGLAGSHRAIGGWIVNSFKIRDQKNINLDEARKNFKRAIEICEPLYYANPENVNVALSLAKSYHSIGNLLNIQKMNDEARKNFGKMVMLCETLYSTNPENENVLNYLAWSHIELCDFLKIQGFATEAQKSGERAVEICKIYYSAYSKSIRTFMMVRRCYISLGKVLISQGFVDKAKMNFERAVEISEKYYSICQLDICVVRLLENAYHCLWEFLRDQGCIVEAKKIFIKSIEIMEKIYSNNPEITCDDRYMFPLPRSYVIFGNFLEDNDFVDEARESYKKAIDLIERAYSTDVKSFEAKSDLEMAYERLSILLILKWEFNNAKELLEKALNSFTGVCT